MANWRWRLKPNSTEFEPSAEQREIIDDDSTRTLVVTASAGAGKTGTIVQKYLRRVRGGLSPDRVLAITFTRKAAAEMKSRIVRQFVSEGRLDEARIAETGPIQTIHGFCERLLRENALEAGLDPEFRVMEDLESHLFRQQHIQAALSSEGYGDPEIAEVVQRITSQAGYKSEFELLSDSIKRVLRLRDVGQSPESIEQRYQSTESTLEFWKELRLAEFDDETRERYQFVSAEELPEHLGRLAPGKKLIPDTEGIAEGARHTSALIRLGLDVWIRMEVAMLRDQALDFCFLETLAVRLMENSHRTRERLAKQFELVIVDEAQDLNPMQYRLLKQLDPAQMLIVGDAQQSIFGFREASPALFAELCEQHGAKSLTINRRSEQGILTLVDRLFQQLWPDRYKKMGQKLDDFQGVEIWKTPESADFAGVLQRLRNEGVGWGEIGILTSTNGEAARIAQQLRDVDIPCRVGGTVGYFARLEVRDLANALTAAERPSDDFALAATLLSLIAGVSLDSVAILAKEGRIWEALADFEPPIEEDRTKIEAFCAWFQPLTIRAGRAPAWEALAQILAQSPLLENLARRIDGGRMILNSRRLLEIAAKQPAASPTEFAANIAELRELRYGADDRPSETPEDEVTITTVHLAKGLEWPVVVLTEMNRKPLEPNREQVQVDSGIGLVAASFDRKPHAYHSFASDRAYDRELQEHLRKLYVALTRAKRRLILMIPPQSKAGSWAKEIETKVGIQTAVAGGAKQVDLTG